MKTQLNQSMSSLIDIPEQINWIKMQTEIVSKNSQKRLWVSCLVSLFRDKLYNNIVHYDLKCESVVYTKAYQIL